LTVRAFLAIPRDTAWSESARRFVETVRSTLPEAGWTRPPAWHLTIKFLGETSREALAAFRETISRVAADAAPGELRAQGAIAFPSRGPARVLAIAFAQSEALAGLDRLAAAAEGEARRLGLQKEDRPFHPHVTLARARSRWPARAVDHFREAAAAWSFPLWRAGSCVIYTSRLEPSGAVHTPVAEWPFGGASADEER
jgi:RNA 2',3'-cyclic 3'-phosphodiesterase